MSERAMHDVRCNDAMRAGFANNGARLYALARKTLADHGFYRVAFPNWHTVAPGVYRSSQPYPFQLARAAAAGVATVVNLRGPSASSYYLLEREACDTLGLTLVDFPVFSRAPPKPSQLHDARRLFQTITYPALLHCKSGADRAGLMSALYLMIQQGLPVELAMGQLSLRYGHFRRASTGILDAFLAAYAAHRGRTGEDFFDWVDNHYDPAGLARAFRQGMWTSVLADRAARQE